MLQVIALIAVPAIAFAQQSSSTSYQINEAFFGTGGQLCVPGSSGNSTNYCAKSSIGELGVGATSSTSYSAQAGGNTGREEYLEFTVNSSNTSFGALAPGAAATTTGTFSVKSYLGGYVVQNASDPPTSSGVNAHTIAPMTVTAARNATLEQFGINLVANTSPATFGANPVQVPSGTFSFGQPNTGYGTTNQYKYNKGDIIANSSSSTPPASSGTTNYTVSYMLNTINSTPAGHYTFNHIMVATSTY